MAEIDAQTEQAAQVEERNNICLLLGQNKIIREVEEYTALLVIPGRSKSSKKSGESKERIGVLPH